MANTIGLRCYQIVVTRNRDTSTVDFDDSSLEFNPREFLSNFIQNHINPIQNNDMERSWYFEELAAPSPGNSNGHIHYGTFGFESNFVNTKTKKKNYRRKIDDVEEIPLFYQIWCPKDGDFGLAAFQSFQGRSCIGMVVKKIEEMFTAANPGFVMRFRKLLPNDGSGALYSKAPVKQLKLIKRKASSDITDRYLAEAAPDGVDFEITLTARRNKSLGPFGSLTSSLSRDQKTGLVVYDGVEFTEAVAKVRVGKKYRPVGVFGANGEAGVIDITEDIVKASDGHPTVESLRIQTKDILIDFHHSLSGK